jgi:hypothetical protein
MNVLTHAPLFSIFVMPLIRGELPFVSGERTIRICNVPPPGGILVNPVIKTLSPTDTFLMGFMVIQYDPFTGAGHIVGIIVTTIVGTMPEVVVIAGEVPVWFFTVVCYWHPAVSSTATITSTRAAAA